MDVKTEENLFGLLRQRTETEELKQHLKTTVGGYTKNSVMEYLTELRKRQQSSSETFNQNMQILLEEKENLKTENEKLLMQISQAKADFLRLAESRKLQEHSKTEATSDNKDVKIQQAYSNPETANDNIVYLQSTVQAAATEDTNPQTTYSVLENENEALKSDISEKQAELDKARNEIKEQKELLESEMLEARKQRELISELSSASKELENELQYLKEKFSEDVLEKLNDQIAELTASVCQQEILITQLKGEAEDKDNSIKTLLDENITMMKSMELMSKSLDHMAIQNEKLITANNALGQAYEEENKKVVKLINEISEETVEKLILERKLEELMGSLSSYDLSKSDTSDASKAAESKTSIA